MEWVRQQLQRVTARIWISTGISVVLIAGAIPVLLWARAATALPQSVEEKWNVAVRQLGVEPVYPPEEDIEVGDVFAIVSYDSLPENGVIDSPLANHAVRLWRIDLSAAVNDNYKNTYVFSHLTEAESVQKTKDQNDSVSEDSIFKLREHRSDLPIVTFPNFRISDNRSAHFGLIDNILGIFGATADSNSDVETEVSITKTETYGVPYLVAENALINFCEEDFPSACQEDAVRKVLSTRIGPQIYDIGLDRNTNKPRYRMSVEVGLINRVFLTRAINTRLARSARDKGSSSFSPNAKSLSRQVTPDKGKDAHDSNNQVLSESRISSGAEGSDAGGVELSGSAADTSELAVSFDGSALVRPVVFGFESVRFLPKSSPISGLVSR